MKALRFRRSIMFACKLLVTAAMMCVFLYAYLNWYEAYFFFKGNFVLVFLYGFVYALFLQTYGGYRIGALRLRELVFSNVLAGALANFIIYLVMSLIRYGFLPLWPLLLCSLVQGLGAMGLYVGILRIHERLYPPLEAVLIRSEAAGDIRATGRFVAQNTRYAVGLVLSEAQCSDLPAAVAAYPAVIVGAVSPAFRARLMAHCFEADKQLLLLPSMEDILLNNATQYMAEDTLALRCKNRGFSPEQAAVKRGMDLLFASLGLLLASPLMLLSALAVKLTDGGPVFFSQERLTQDGKVFRLIKFRSMVVDAERETGAVLAGQNDPRITPVGRFLRACRLDELPQFFNILKGDMSLVGPRPERPELFREICREFPQFRYRLKVKAGLTGYAQLYGKYNTTFEDKVRLDLFYIEKASLLQDLQLLCYTFKILFLKESAEGVTTEEEIGHGTNA